MKQTILQAIAAGFIITGTIVAGQRLTALENDLEASIDRERALWYELHPLEGPTPADEKLAVLLNGIAGYQLRPDLTEEERMQVNAIMGRDGEN